MTTALGTPLGPEERLHVEGLEKHLDDQAQAGVKGILVAGTMGMMQLLRDPTYAELARKSVDFWAGKGEILVGAGDASYGRTRDRIEFLNTLKVDGIALLCPYFIQFSQDEIIDYFQSLAEVSRAPIFLYDLPQRTRTKLEIPTVITLSKHPNIAGIKCSDEPAWTRHLRDVMAEHRPDFRIIIAQPDLVDMTLRTGFNEQLDGMWALAPQWAANIGIHAAAGDWDAAAAAQRDLTKLKQLFIRYGVMPAVSALMNARGIPGSFAPKPYRSLAPKQLELLLDEPLVKTLIASHPRSRSVSLHVRS